MYVRDLKQLQAAMQLDTEVETLEFKEASASYKLNEAARYSVAIANEGGGSLILGVTNKKPRKAVGTKAIPDLDEAKKCIYDWIGLRVDVVVIEAPKRIVSFVVPPRPIGRAVHYKGAYLMRAGSHLRPMSWEALERIRNEGVQDFSSQPLPEAVDDVLSEALIERFRNGWAKKNSKKGTGSKIRNWSDDELLENAGLTIDGQPTYAALILLGREVALNKYLPQSELIYEFRDDENAIRYDYRDTIRDGFLASADELWKLVDARNYTIPYQEGLFKYNLLAFDEESTREAICNAVSHRDYRNEGSVFIRQSPTSIEVESPGGFPNGVTVDNILFKSVPRNRRLAEAMDRCGLVERSGQGMDLIYSHCIMTSRPLPDLTRSDNERVFLYLRSEITDGRIIAFFEQINKETLETFSGIDFLAVDLVRRNEPLPKEVQKRIPRLINLGILEKSKRKPALSSRLLSQIGEGPGSDRDAIKRYLDQVGDKGASISEIIKLLNKDRERVRWLLDEMRKDGLAHVRGRTRGARWYLGADKN